MSNDLKTWKRLIEDQFPTSYEDEDERLQGEQDELDMQRYQREHAMTMTIMQAVKAAELSLAVETHAILYSEEDGEATIKLDDDPTLEQLQAIASLGASLKVMAVMDQIILTLKIDPSARIVEGEVVDFKKKSKKVVEPEDDDPTPGAPAVAMKRAVNEGRRRVAESQDELLPCPFCGSEPIRTNDENGDHISCSNWNCVQPQITTPPGEDAAHFWNRRV